MLPPARLKTSRTHEAIALKYFAALTALAAARLGPMYHHYWRSTVSHDLLNAALQLGMSEVLVPIGASVAKFSG